MPTGRPSLGLDTNAVRTTQSLSEHSCYTHAETGGVGPGVGKDCASCVGPENHGKGEREKAKLDLGQ